jgi:lipopolysaccharide export system permease protein
MKIIDRYLTRQILVTALFAITVLTVVLVLGNVFKKLLDQFVNQNAPASILISIIAYVLPFSLTFTIPWGFLTSVLLVFGRMSAENEITALRSSGVSIPRLCVPVAILAILFTGICAYINLEVAPRSQLQMRNAIFDLATKDPLSVFGDDKVIDVFPGQKIYVEKNENEKISNMFVYAYDPEYNLTTVTAAGRGSLGVKEMEVKGGAPGEKQMQLVLSYQDLRYEQVNRPVPKADPKTPEEIKAAAAARWDLRGIKSGIVASEGELVVSLKELYEKKKKVGGVGILSMTQLLDNSKPEATVELNKRLSNAFATIALGLLAIPLGITAQRKETSVGFAISLGIAMLYFVLLIAADMARNNPKLHPELLVWLPTVTFLAVGVYRFAKLARK